MDSELVEVVQVLDAVVERVEKTLSQRAWDETVNAVLRASVTPAASGGGLVAAEDAARFAVRVADYVAEARRVRVITPIPIPHG